MPTLFFVMAGGAIGAGARHLTSRATLSLFGAGLPYGTLTVNLAGGLLMGLLTGLLARWGTVQGETWRLFLGVGILGGFTTFSSFSLDTVLLWQRGEAAWALGYMMLSVIGSIAALVAGLFLSRVPA